MSLLDKALEAKVSSRQKKGASTDELELAVAWFRGHVSGHQVLAALGEKSANVETRTKSWAVKVLRAGLANGLAVVTIEDPEEDDFDKKHEAAKATPLATPARAVSR